MPHRREERHIRGGAGAVGEYQDQAMQYIVSSSRRGVGAKNGTDDGKLMTARGRGMRTNTCCNAETYDS